MLIIGAEGAEKKFRRIFWNIYIYNLVIYFLSGIYKRYGIKGIIGGGAAPGGGSEKVIKEWQRVQSKHGIETDLGGNLCIGFTFHIAESEEQAIKEAKPFFEENMKMFGPLGMVKGLTDHQVQQLSIGSDSARKANFPTLEQAVESGSWLVGTADSIAEKLMEIQDRYPALKSINVGQVIGTPEKVILEQLERFAKEVINKKNTYNIVIIVFVKITKN